MLPGRITAISYMLETYFYIHSVSLNASDMLLGVHIAKGCITFSAKALCLFFSIFFTMQWELEESKQVVFWHHQMKPRLHTSHRDERTVGTTRCREKSYGHYLKSMTGGEIDPLSKCKKGGQVFIEVCFHPWPTRKFHFAVEVVKVKVFINSLAELLLKIFIRKLP